MVQGLGAVLGLDHDVRLGQATLVVASRVAALLADQRTAPHRFLGVEQRLVHLPLGLDQLDGRARLGVGVRSDGGDRLAFERRLARQPLDLAGDEHTADARGLLRKGGVDAGQRGVRVRAAQERRVQHARQPDVGRVARLAARPLVAVDLRRRPTDHLERPAGPLVEGVLLDHDPGLGVAALDLLLGLDQARHDWIASSMRGYVPQRQRFPDIV